MVDITKIDAFVQSSPQPAWLANSQGHCLYANPALERFTGLNFNQINQADWRSFVLEEDRAAATAAWQRSIATGTPYRTQVRMRGFDGVPATVELIAFGHKISEETELWWFTGLHVNGATQQYPQDQAQLQATLNVIPAYTWYANPSGGLTFVNERLSNYLGLPKDHPLRLGIDMGAPWDSHIPLLHPDDREETRRVWSTCLRTGCPGEVSFRARNAEGGYRWFLSCAEPLRASDGTLLYWIGVNLEIDERKKAEFYLAEGQRLAHMGSWAFNAAGFDYWSSELFQIHGLDPDGKAPTVEEYMSLVHPEDRGFVTHAIQKMSADHRGFDFTKRIVRPDGKIRFVRWVGVPAIDGETFRGFVGTGIDVTEQELLTHELRRREAYLTEAQRISHTGSFGWNPGTGEIVWSEETYRIFEYDSALKPTLDSLLQRVHPQDRALAQQVADRVSQTGRDFEHECRLLLPDGRVKHTHFIGHALLDASGNIEFIGAATDITDRKHAEEKIRKQEMEFRQILDLAPRLVAVFGPDRERLYANRILLEYLGLTLEEWREKFSSSVPSMEYLHPDDWQRVTRDSDRALSNGSDFEVEMRLRKSDGSYRWFLARYSPLRDEQITRWCMTGTDIEDRKRAEERLQHENVALREEIDKASLFEEIVGTSAVLQTVLSRIAKVAPTDSTVLITGETGTGKELVARAIHKRSRRSSGVFVSVNCAAVPRDLIASELFGHEKGAFTGATQRRLGRFELAQGGTIFLDEIGELPVETQIALLRVLQEHEFQRVGGDRPIISDVRVIAATNRNLPANIAAGAFRSDLFYRLNVFPIEIPPLRERQQDIPLLVEYFIDRYARKTGKKIRQVNKNTLDLLRSYPWPGNIRELQNVIERSVIVSETETFSIDESWISRQPAASQVTPGLDLAEKLAAQEKEMIETALRESSGRVYGPSGAAAKLGMPRSTLESKIRSLRINKNLFKTNGQ